MPKNKQTKKADVLATDRFLMTRDDQDRKVNRREFLGAVGSTIAAGSLIYSG